MLTESVTLASRSADAREPALAARGVSAGFQGRRHIAICRRGDWGGEDAGSCDVQGLSGEEFFDAGGAAKGEKSVSPNKIRYETRVLPSKTFFQKSFSTPLTPD